MSLRVAVALILITAGLLVVPLGRETSEFQIGIRVLALLDELVVRRELVAHGDASLWGLLGSTIALLAAPHRD